LSVFSFVALRNSLRGVRPWKLASSWFHSLPCTNGRDHVTFQRRKSNWTWRSSVRMRRIFPSATPLSCTNVDKNTFPKLRIQIPHTMQVAVSPAPHTKSFQLSQDSLHAYLYTCFFIQYILCCIPPPQLKLPVSNPVILGLRTL
jgi:hypothetical protein